MNNNVNNNMSSSNHQTVPPVIDELMDTSESNPPSNILEPAKITLSKPSPQFFSLPLTMMYYLAENAKESLKEKLLKSCKTLKLMIHSFEEHEVEKLHGRNLSQHHYEIAPKSLKIVHTLDLLFLTEKDLLTLFKKVDISTIQTLHFFSCFLTFPLKFFDFVLQPSLTTFWCTAHFDTPISPSLKAFEVLQNANEIYLTCIYNSMTKADLKKLLQIERTTKIQVCGLAVNNNVDPEDIIKFVDIHLELHRTPRSRLTLAIRGQNKAMQDYVKETVKQREIENDAYPEIKLEFRNI